MWYIFFQVFKFSSHKLIFYVCEEEEEKNWEREFLCIVNTYIEERNDEKMKRWRNYILLINFTSSWKTWKKEKLLIDYENSLLFDMFFKTFLFSFATSYF